MNREPSTTPHERTNLPTRRLFEAAYSKNEYVLEHTIRLDTAIKNLQQYIHNEPADMIEAREWLQEYTEKILQTSTNEQLNKSSITDSARFAAHIAFAEEQLLAPLAYGDRDNYSLRRNLTDGVLGKSIELIEPLLKQISRRTKADDIRETVGAINEQTAIALLNFSENSDHLAVPSETTDDILRHTDAYLYSLNKDQLYSHRYRISVKTNEADAERERERGREIVISGADMQNSNLTISRLLVRYIEGTPGISTDELETLRRANEHVWSVVLRQADHSNFNVCHDSLIVGKDRARAFHHAAETEETLVHQIAQSKKTAS